MKGLTVTYRCDDAAWGMPVIGALLLVGGLYVGGGIVLGVQTKGAKVELSAHPHHRHWQTGWRCTGWSTTGWRRCREAGGVGVAGVVTAAAGKSGSWTKAPQGRAAA
jgi:hypothetical protein